MTREAFLGRLQGVQPAGRGWLAFCPAHADRARRSLSVGTDGSRLLVKCFVGCSADAIARALGLSLRDLFIEGIERAETPARDGHLVATYDYRDEGGELLYQVARFAPKDFRPRRADGRWGLGDVRRVLYRLPDLAEQTRVVVVEGEKDADRLGASGIPATTSQGGAQAWRDEYAQQLVEAGVREVVILPDHDEPGEQYAAAVARACLTRGLRVKVVRLPDLPPKGDVSDWLDAGHPAAELQAVVETVPWSAAPAPGGPLGMVHVSAALDLWLDAIERGAPPCLRTPFPGLNHLLTGGFAPGELTYLGARAGVGKTAFGLELARAAARDGHGVIVVSREMVALALGRRLLAQDARVPAAALKSGRLSDADWVLVRDTLPKLRALPLWFADRVTSVQEIARLVEGYAEAPPLGLLVVDYLQLVRTEGPVRDRRLEVEAVSQGLKALAVGRRLPVLCLSSLSRPPDGRERAPTLASLRESGQLEHDADIVMFLQREIQQPETVLRVLKNRDGRTGTVHLRFRPECVAFDEGSARHETEEAR